jgi:uncharacterized PurR-regulated membrane protein YhhQ (DUF165 family)
MFSLKIAFLAMTLIVMASNYLVLFPINDWLTWGAFLYPISFLITELTNRLYGPSKARRVVYLGFVLAVFCSFWLANPKIAFASGIAFLSSQLLDIFVFSQFRQATWWYGPLFASFLASLLDAAIFWNIAFFGEEVPILTWAIGDTLVKLLVDIVMLTPFRLIITKRSFQQ